MSVPPKTATVPDPAPPRLLGAGFWMAMSFAMVCVVAGVGFAILGPRLFRAEPAQAPLAAPPAARSLALAIPAPLPVEIPAPAAADPGQIAALNSRIEQLESRELRTSGAAATALAAAAVAIASQGSGPFSEDLAALRAAAPDAPELAALTSLATIGAPSRAALAQSFPEHAARAMGAARTPVEGATLEARLIYALSRVVSLRRVGQVPGDGVEARLARAEQALADGEVTQALAALDGLPPQARSAMADWMAGAERRAAIDRQVAALRTRALRDLTVRPARPASPQEDAAI